eukprot:CAMPEP_0202895230 /NCGR_PEP_ID=MMETSP1392-20130828/4477_1 /ASSEMBLY_ACC=CAM_ASM_000868 /TAXON_ID=225041 /ORGANISM="Chlamydomonas chlamydogama, Strain SAG 11-48b" /LENGTH=190 /DNA_ID=CAMNT_0049580167 /DNA_START=87 /DNA_END=661 /DNA_ORIENTATION=+
MSMCHYLCPHTGGAALCGSSASMAQLRTCVQLTSCTAVLAHSAITASCCGALRYWLTWLDVVAGDAPPWARTPKINLACQYLACPWPATILSCHYLVWKSMPLTPAPGGSRDWLTACRVADNHAADLELVLPAAGLAGDGDAHQALLGLGGLECGEVDLGLADIMVAVDLLGVTGAARYTLCLGDAHVLI